MAREKATAVDIALRPEFSTMRRSLLYAATRTPDSDHALAKDQASKAPGVKAHGAKGQPAVEDSRLSSVVKAVSHATGTGCSDVVLLRSKGGVWRTRWALGRQRSKKHALMAAASLDSLSQLWVLKAMRQASASS